jgi:hypothetical protein
MIVILADPPPVEPTDKIERDRYGRPLIRTAGNGKPIPYTRASSLGRALTDSYTLTLWKQRQTALGLAKRADLLTMVSAKHDDRAALNELCERAMIAVESDAAATMGTALHALTEIVDRGEQLGEHVPAAALERLRTYWRTIRAGQLVPLECETFIVCDELRTAGTFDRLYRTPGGPVIVGDLKTGMSLLNDRGQMWQSSAIEIAVQLAVYANGQRYDPATGERSSLHPDLDPTRGVVVHLPALSGPCRLIQMDLVMGMVLARFARDVLQARKTRQLAQTKLTYPKDT